MNTDTELYHQLMTDPEKALSLLEAGEYHKYIADVFALLKKLSFSALRDLVYKNLKFINYLDFNDWAEHSKNKVDEKGWHLGENELYECLMMHYIYRKHHHQKKMIGDKIYKNIPIDFETFNIIPEQATT